MNVADTRVLRSPACSSTSGDDVLNTRRKIALARLSQRPILAMRQWLGLGLEVEVTRAGLRWRIDLREGIDYSIYLLGAFERRVARVYGRMVRSGATVLDIGANIGAHTLPLARLAGPEGRVLAFEPTDWAFAKLSANVALNPGLSSRIRCHHMFLLDTDGAPPPPAVFSSWPLQPTPDVHPTLRGRAMPTGAAAAGTLDSVLVREGVHRVDFVKMDVDGNEAAVLRGARRLLTEFRPTLLFEIAPYLLRERGEGAENMLAPMREAGYEFFGVDRSGEFDAESLRLGDGQALTLIARPPAGR